MCEKEIKTGRGVEKAHHWLADAFLSFCYFPIYFLVLSNFGHVMKMVFFPFSARIFFPVPHFKMFPFHSGIVVCFCFFCLLNGEDRE